MTVNNLCSSCTNIGCEFYMPPRMEPDNCGNYVVMQSVTELKGMTLEENIKAILECNFAIAKDEVIEAATKRIMEQIESQKDELLKGDTDDNLQM